MSHITAKALIEILKAPAAYEMTARFLTKSPTLSIERRGHVVKVTRVDYSGGFSSLDIHCDVSGETMILPLRGKAKDTCLEDLFKGYAKPLNKESFEHVSGVSVRVSSVYFRTGLEADSVENPYGFSDPQFLRYIGVRYSGPDEGKITVNNEIADIAKFPRTLTIDFSFHGEAKVREFGCVISANAALLLRDAGVNLVLGSCEDNTAYEVTWMAVDRFVSDDVTGRHEDDETYTHGDIVREVCAVIRWADRREQSVSEPMPNSVDELEAVIENMQRRMVTLTDRMAGKKAAYGF